MNRTSPDYWTWEKAHQLGRDSSDGGVRMMCEKLAVKIVKEIPLLENDIRYLNRIENKSVVILRNDHMMTKKMKWNDAQSFLNSGEWKIFPLPVFNK
jgi:hypothetical protein